MHLFIILFLTFLIAGCTGGNETTESGGSMRRSVKYPYPAPIQEVRIDQPAPKATPVEEVKVEKPRSEPTRGTDRNNDVQKRKGEQSRKYSPPYP
jgi:hypothetical protein